MFKREHHRRVATILQSLNTDILDQCGCLFGGGTAIVLAYGEYRESVDIDFLISDRDGYQRLRSSLRSDGLKLITRAGLNLQTSRDVRVDQYGIRTMVHIDGVDIKFEIVFESRITLEKPIEVQRICGVSTLVPLDMAATKLLANSDRWPDDSVFSRDLIDLAMITLPKEDLIKAKSKAAGAYGESVQKDLKKAIQTLGSRKGRLEKCMDSLQIDDFSMAVLWQRIKDLQSQ